MENQSVFKFSYDSPSLRPLFLSIARWHKTLSIIGFIYQVFFIRSAVRDFNAYQEDADRFPYRAGKMLGYAIYDCFVVLVYTTVYILAYYSAMKLEKAVTEGSEQDLQRFCKLSIIMNKLTVVFLAIAILCSAYLAWGPMLLH